MENLSELAQKYRDEMLRMYGARKPTQSASEPESMPVFVPAEPQADVFPEDTNETENTDEATEVPEITEDTGLSDDTTDEPPPLPEYIPTTPIPVQWAAQEAYENFNTAEGRLRVVAAVANSAYPVPGAQVTVCTHIGGRCYLNYILVTDENGETPIVSLAAPPASLSQLPETNIPYAVYDIHIFANGFFRSEALGVHIFDNITTRQEFQMIPLPIYPDIHAAHVNPNSEGRTEEVN